MTRRRARVGAEYHDPLRGKIAHEIAAELRARRLAPEQYVTRERLVGRALCILAEGPLDALEFRDRLALEGDDDRLVELGRHVVVVRDASMPSGFAAWDLERHNSPGAVASDPSA